MTDRELMQQALEALEWLTDETKPAPSKSFKKTATALRERLAQPEQPSVPWSAALESVWGEPEPEPIKESSATHSHLWIGDLYGKEKNT